MSHRWRALRALSLTVAMVVVAALLPGQAAADGNKGRNGKGWHGNSCERGANDSYKELLDCVTLKGVRKHQKALQEIAEANEDPYYPGTRAAGTEGYDDSAAYVAWKLRRAGYRVSFDPVNVTFNFPAVLRQLTPVAATYETGPFTGSGNGTVEGRVIPVDINLDPPRATSSGCEASDFAGLDFSGPADIALVQRGTCNFGNKALNADNAGAEAVIIFNQGNAPDREGLIVANAATLNDGTTVAHSIPVVGASFAQGQALAQAGSTAFVQVLPAETRVDYNVIADRRGKNDNNVVMAGSHLDSVIQGPGIQDNGSGSAALLETALMMADVKPQNSMRFAWWAAEEQGLVGSRDYVTGLSQAERDRIALYMNYDMIGSPNYFLGVYDADESTFPAPAGVPIPDGSTAIEDVYESYYTWIDEPYEDSEFSGRSDYQAFIQNGIPAGGLFTGAEVVKTAEQQAIWGGVAGEAFDQCYHQACDDYDNIDLHALRVNSDLVAFAQLTFAFSTESVNGVRGKRVPGKPVRLPEPAGPEGTFADDSGGGGHHGHDQEN